MNRSFRCFAALALTASLATVAPPTVAAAGADRNPELYAPGADVLGHSRVFWASEIAKWEQEIPARNHPFLNPESPFQCTTDVFPVAYVSLPHSISEQAPCEVPAGMPISLVPFGWECSTAEGEVGLLESFHGRTWMNLRACADTLFRRDLGVNAISLKMWIDGERIGNIRTYTLTTRPRIVDLPENNVWEPSEPSDVEVPAGPTKSISRTLQLIFKPLSPGLHRIRMHAEIPAFSDEPLRDVWRIRVVDRR